ncbi:MAG: UDP-N-acetylmuramoyl-L-alanine--D-glutamate ligase [Gammaproteobacteria bacterium]
MKHDRKKILVVGLGNTGLSCVRFLLAAGHEVVVTDNRQSPPSLDAVKKLLPDESIHVGGFPQSLVGFAESAVVSPGVPLDDSFIRQLRSSGVSLCGDIELFSQVADARILAVTGSNGKSTVTTLLGEVLCAAGKEIGIGGNIGTPVLELLDNTVPDYYALELSSFQIDLTHEFNAFAATVLNISADHLDRYTDIEQYAAAKSRLLSFAQHLILNRDDPFVSRMAKQAVSCRTFGVGAPRNELEAGVAQVNGQPWLCMGSRLLMPVADLRFRATHNVMNALAVRCFTDLIDVENEIVREVFSRFAGLPHRMQWVTESKGVTWINDSKGTNVGATLAALEGLPGPIVLIAGGESKGADFRPLATVARNKVRNAILFGKDAEKLADALQAETDVCQVEDIPAAVNTAHRVAQKGDTVLLSPACSSLDMFSGFAERGEVFMHAVHEVTS